MLDLFLSLQYFYKRLGSGYMEFLNNEKLYEQN